MYAYNLGGTVEQIGTLVERDIIRAIDDPRKVFSGYDSIEREYHICIPLVTGVVADWTYNLRSKTWVYNEYADCTSIETVEIGLGGLTIDELGDVSIDSLEPAIDDLSPTDTNAPIVVRCQSDGDIEVVDPTMDTDNGVNYETDIISKIFEFPNINDLFSSLRIDVAVQKSGTLFIYGSRSGGLKDDWELFESYSLSKVNEVETIKYQKTVRAKRFAWRITAQDGLFDIVEYEVDIYPSGTTRQGD